MSRDDCKQNVAIIGGGTGLTTAWALENQPNFKVTLFDSQDR
ncbi:NAD(P)-binding protein [Legionella waltersii]|nr:NAD(P)-binding protein [Legionella waltersii]SNV11087.1 amine oxidase, flavin containing [Legionella waltersii]